MLVSRPDKLLCILCQQIIVYSFRVWIQPRVLPSHNMSPSCSFLCLLPLCIGWCWVASYLFQWSILYHVYLGLPVGRHLLYSTIWRVIHAGLQHLHMFSNWVYGNVQRNTVFVLWSILWLASENVCCILPSLLRCDVLAASTGQSLLVIFLVALVNLQSCLCTVK